MEGPNQQTGINDSRTDKDDSMGIVGAGAGDGRRVMGEQWGEI